MPKERVVLHVANIADSVEHGPCSLYLVPDKNLHRLILITLRACVRSGVDESGRDKQRPAGASNKLRFFPLLRFRRGSCKHTRIIDEFSKVSHWIVKTFLEWKLQQQHGKE